MMNWMQERSKYEYYDENGGEGIPSPEPWYEFPLFLLFFILSPFLFAIFAVLFTAGMTIYGFYFVTKYTVNNGNLKFPFPAYAGVVLAFILVTLFDNKQINFGEHAAFMGFSLIFIFVFTLAPLTGVGLLLIQSITNAFKANWLKRFFLFGCVSLFAVLFLAPRFANPQESLTAIPPSTARIVEILVDDFNPQPYQGNSEYFYNRLEGDRGAINATNLSWDVGQVRMTIAPGNSWGGMWMSLNHPIREGLPINFSAILPDQILPKYQSQISGIQIQIADGSPGRAFKLELKYGDTLQWQKQVILNDGDQILDFKLPALANIDHMVLILEQAQPNDYVVIERVSFTTQTHIKDTATSAFVWSYGMLLNNWNPATGLARDKAKDTSGEFDAIQSTGSLAAATAVADQLGVINRADAIEIVNKIGDTLLNDMPRYHGLLPHWVRAVPDGQYIILEGTEWSSVDTVIAALGLLEAQASLGLDTSATEQLIKDIDWNSLATPNGISHGYTYDGILIPYAWDVFGGESWLVQLAYASATGQIAALAYPSAPTANGSGFIDELAWLYVAPPKGKDIWGTNWASYRKSAAQSQISYYPNLLPDSCFTKLGLFGLSAGEVPAPWLVPQNNIYQAYGIGGAFAGPNDGQGFGSAVVAPHYSAMIASVRSKDSLKMWDWLISNGYFTPLNNIESLTFTSDSNCAPTNTEWNQLKGSWNLSLQTLGWGKYLAEQRGGRYSLWQALEANSFLRNGYLILAGKSK